MGKAIIIENCSRGHVAALTALASAVSCCYNDNTMPQTCTRWLGLLPGCFNIIVITQSAAASFASRHFCRAQMAFLAPTARFVGTGSACVLLFVVHVWLGCWTLSKHLLVCSSVSFSLPRKPLNSYSLPGKETQSSLVVVFATSSRAVTLAPSQRQGRVHNKVLLAADTAKPQFFSSKKAATGSLVASACLQRI